METREPRAVPSLGEQLGADPGPAGEHFPQPGHWHRVRAAGQAFARTERGEPQREAGRSKRRDIVPRQPVAAFRGVAPATGDELRQVAVASAVMREQDEPRAVDEGDFTAEDQGQTSILRRHMRPHGTRQRAFVGQRQRGIALASGALDELLGV